MNGATRHECGVAGVRVCTALGEFVVTASAGGVRTVTPAARAAAGDDGWDLDGGTETHDRLALAHAREAAEALRRYGGGEPVRFEGPLDLQGPALHLAVWERLRAISMGTTTTYGEIAAAVGQPGEARAIGRAIGANPACILVPCHRVVGSDGSLRGFAWGLDLKRRLLAHEGCLALSLFA